MARQIGQHVIGMNPKSIGSLSSVNVTKKSEEDGEDKAPSTGDIDDDIASMVAMLLSDDAVWINGQVYHVNGGTTMR